MKGREDYKSLAFTTMFITLAIILAVLWLLGVVFSVTAGGLIHLLLILAVISIVYHFVRGTATEIGERHAPRI